MWYDIDKTLSYNALLNFVVGVRGVGKTYACKKRVIKNFLKDGSQFVYLRRFDTEIKQSQLQNFWNDVCVEFGEHEFGVKGKTFFIDDKVCGYAISLTKAAQYKSVPFPDVTMIIFDEFIIDEGLIRYLPDEVTAFNELYSTVARLRDVRVFFLSNAITFTNPYFLYFDIEKPTGKNKIKKKGDILIQFVENEDYINAYLGTRFGKIISNTEYSNYAMRNKFLRDNNSFIMKMPPNMVCKAVLIVDEQHLGLYTGNVDNWFISDTYDKTCTNMIAISANSHNEETSMRQAVKNQLLLEDLQQRYFRGDLRFTSIRAKNLISKKLFSIRR